VALEVQQPFLFGPAHRLHFHARIPGMAVVYSEAPIRGFPTVKLFSRYVTFPLAWPIALKGAADAAGKAVMLVITIVAARRLNADAFGVMAFAMATGWLLAVGTDAGLSMHLARETARDRTGARRLLVEIVSLRTGLAFVAATFVVALAPALVPRHWRVQFVLVVMAQLAGAVVETIAHYFRGLQRSEIEAAIHSAQRLVTLAAALAVLWWWRRLDYLGIALLVPAIAAMLVSMLVANALSIRLKAETTTTITNEQWSITNEQCSITNEQCSVTNEQCSITNESHAGLTPAIFLRDVLPLGAGLLISALYFRIDVYFIQQWHGFQPVGGYNAAFRLIEALRLLPAAVLAVTFPLLVQAGDTHVLRGIAGRLALAGTALAVVCAAGAPFIVPMIYGDTYAYASTAFAVLALALPLLFLNYALTHQVIAWDGQRAYLLIAASALAGNVIGNLVLVPTRGIVGAAMATVLTEIIVTAGCAYVLRAKVRYEAYA
jgi:O-antigen/teichoic acid export membrane protein